MNTLYNSKETIAALATPVGIGGIAVIRISGQNAFSIVDSVFNGQTKIAQAISHTIHYGNVIEPGTSTSLDTVLISVFRNPHSYTGEDVIEISVHGGYYVSQKILSVLYTAGARPAQPGEFTLRAFLGGKLDLAQAEAVADIIHAKTEKSHKASLEQLSGRLSKHIGVLRSQLLDLCSVLELELDFSQEGIELTDKVEAVKKIESIELKIKEMLDSYVSGKLIREGVKVALAGRPNTGKSSLLNLLLGEERAIVSDIPGTTRDIIEESIVLEGLEFVFTDTAGLREAFDVIEKEGIRRTTKILQNADLTAFVIDSSLPLAKEDVNLYKQIIDSLRKHVHVLFILNKSDIRHPEFNSDNLLPDGNVVEISCLTHQGINVLKKMLVQLSIPTHDSVSSSLIITNARHKEALDRAAKSLQAAKKSIKSGLSGDFIAVDLRDALNYLGEIIGLTTPDDILNNIFSHFCIGK